MDIRAVLRLRHRGRWFGYGATLGALALVTGLIALVEMRARVSNISMLYLLVVLGADDLEGAIERVADRLREELSLEAVAVELSEGDRVWLRAISGEVAAGRFSPAAGLGSISAIGNGAPAGGDRPSGMGRRLKVVPPHPRSWVKVSGRERMRVVPVEAECRRVGDLVLVRPHRDRDLDALQERLVSLVATQLGAAVERARLRREATEAEILRRADELKTALLNAVSHDLRTPLASIIASAGSLRQTDVEWSEAQRREFAEAIEEEGRRLNGIVGNLLDLSRMEGGTLRPEKDWYDLGALVDDVLGRLRPLLARHRVEVDVPDDLPPVPLDYVEIDQVLSNLVENATKYTPPGTAIRIAARREGDSVRVEVVDGGAGIPPDALPRLFERFYRADGEGPRPQGTGLGLAVVKGLVEAHGGAISAANRTEGGAVFGFTLSLGAAVSSAQPAAGSVS